MDAPTLMQKLVEMDRALDRQDPCAVRNLIIEAQEAVRRLERKNEVLTFQNADLRRRLDEDGLPEPESCADFDRKLFIWRTTHFFTT